MAEETSALLIPRVCLINFAVFPSRLASPRLASRIAEFERSISSLQLFGRKR